MTLREKIEELSEKELDLECSVFHAYNNQNNAFYLGDILISARAGEDGEIIKKVSYTKTLTPFLDEEVIDNDFYDEDVFLKEYQEEHITTEITYKKES